MKTHFQDLCISLLRMTKYQTEQLKQKLLFSFLEFGSPRSECWAIPWLGTPLSLACTQRPSLCALTRPFLCARVTREWDLLCLFFSCFYTMLANCWNSLKSTGSSAQMNPEDRNHFFFPPKFLRGVQKPPIFLKFLFGHQFSHFVSSLWYRIGILPPGDPFTEKIFPKVSFLIISGLSWWTRSIRRRFTFSFIYSINIY